MELEIVSGEGNGIPLQYSCLENSMGGAWWAAVHGVAKSRTRLSSFTFTFHFHALEKETATHSSVLAWRIPEMGEPGGLPSMGSHGVGHDWSNLAAAAEIVTLSKVSWTEKEKYDILYVQDLKRNDTNELIYKTESDSQTWRMNLQIPGWRAGEGIVREFGISMHTLL